LRYVLTYNSGDRIYSLGKITSDYKYTKDLDYPNTRDVAWEKSFPRDSLTDMSKYSLGSLLPVFEISDDVKKEIFDVLNNKDFTQIKPEDDESLGNIKEDFEGQAHEFIKDKISEFDWQKMQDLVAALIRSLGFKTQVSPAGPDRGKDIVASPDGLGLNDPRILVEVKHRKGAMGAPEIRSFLGAFRTGNKGIYVSTGGFSKEARFEAERADHPITLVDIDDLVDLIITNYDNFDIDGRAILPLKKIYWPI
jgi:restriction system protein